MVVRTHSGSSAGPAGPWAPGPKFSHMSMSPEVQQDEIFLGDSKSDDIRI